MGETRWTKLVWTPEIDREIVSLRLNGTSWKGIGEKIGISRESVERRFKRLQVPPPVVETKPQVDPLMHPGREPLPPGHPRSWGILNEGTILAGEPYSMPVRLDLESLRGPRGLRP
jgi:hypothetical protein